MWTDETCDEYAEAMADADSTEPVPGLLTIVDAGDIDMEALSALALR